MNKLLILISLLCVNAIKGEGGSSGGNGGNGNGDDSNGDDGVAGESPRVQHVIYDGPNLPGGRYPYAPRPYRGNRRGTRNDFDILTFLTAYIFLKSRRSTDASTAATTAATAAETTPAVLSGYTSCPNGCQYRIRNGATSPAIARTNCVADGAILGHQMLRSGTQRAAVFATCLGQTTEANVMMYLEDSNGVTVTTDQATWGPNFELYADDGSTVTYNGGVATAAVGFAVNNGFEDIEFENVNTAMGRYICELCP